MWKRREGEAPRASEPIPSILGPMHAYRVGAVLASLGLMVGGCAAISGLNGISEEQCAPNCDGGAPTSDARTTTPDVTVNGHDGAPAMSDDSPAGGEDSSPPPSNDGPVTVVPEAGSDAPVGPCGALNTVENCSACGDKCAADDASTPKSCSGSTCAYTCSTGHLDCNASAAPDLDGCECYAPGATACCQTECPLPHNYDEDTSPPALFYDCVAAGTYNSTLALDACAAFTGDKTQCDSTHTYTCSLEGEDAGISDMVCSDGPNASACDCWGYTGPLAGFMSTGTGKGFANCGCPNPVGGTQWK
jgi:hypothetical protein